jgi:Ca-activated chloride channel family protein
LACLLGAALSCLAAQEPKPEPQERIAVRVDLVNVGVMVTDAQGNFVGDLKRENFRVLDEGVEQPLTHFAPVEAPAQVLVLVETSPAVYLIHQQHLRAAYALLEGLAADDQVALGTYDASVRLALGFTANKLAVGRTLDALHYNLGMGQLNLFDGLGLALDWLAPLPGKKAVVLLTTGLDTSGTGHWEALLQRLRASEVVILPIALGGELREVDTGKEKRKGARVSTDTEEAGLSFAQANRALETIAQATGGRAYFPRDARDFAGIYRQIAVLLRHQYSLGFRALARDARFHKIEVQLRDAAGQPLLTKDSKPAYRISARQGYLAPEP